MAEKKQFSQKEIADMNKKGEEMMYLTQRRLSRRRENYKAVVDKDKKNMKEGQELFISTLAVGKEGKEFGGQRLKGYFNGHNIEIYFLAKDGNPHIGNFSGYIDGVELSNEEAGKVYEKFYPNAEKDKLEMDRIMKLAAEDDKGISKWYEPELKKELSEFNETADEKRVREEAEAKDMRKNDEGKIILQEKEKRDSKEFYRQRQEEYENEGRRRGKAETILKDLGI